MTKERLKDLVKTAIYTLSEDIQNRSEEHGWNRWDPLEERRTIKWICMLAEQYKNPDPDFERKLKESIDLD